MRMPDADASSAVLADTFGEYHHAALRAAPPATAIASEFGARQQSLRTAEAARQAASRAAVAAEALKEQAEGEAEDVLREVEGMLLVACKKQRNQDPYRQVFPDNLLGAVRPRGAAQVVEARRVAGLIGPTNGAPLAKVPASLGPVAVRLRAAADALERAEASDRAAELALEAAFATELAERRRWREQYRKDEGLLIAIFPDNLRKVEKFFKDGRRTKKSASSGATASPG